MKYQGGTLYAVLRSCCKGPSPRHQMSSIRACSVSFHVPYIAQGGPAIFQTDSGLLIVL